MLIQRCEVVRRRSVIQQVLTEEIFAKAFGDSDFHRENNLAHGLNLLDKGPRRRPGAPMRAEVRAGGADLTLIWQIIQST
ncbi:MAG: hypothetical protein A3E25_16485 [Burkholderiales bacterium RIFCSPHIGHO2_12_FULL_69_20]|nr:MAG: hypothetical protein A3E25_16485 [Burkholderiales bacterium RIFCSPHIGHO2_12_FULL_69_20]